jgi:hypothetical protein
MKKPLSIAALLCLFLSDYAFSQARNATVTGTVTDASAAVLPSVTVTATNNATGVVTTVITNEAGAYNLPSLLPGVYTISAELPGFQKQTYTNTQLGNAVTVRLNFTLQVASQAQSVEVTIAADTLIATSSSSVGDVLSETKIRDLPVVGNNVLDLISTMAGVRITNPDAVFGQDATTFAGIGARNTNVQRDGVTVDAGGRYPTGIQAATRMNPDLIGEVRMILTPVDAEYGRGNGQIQLLTRSGTNAFHGAVVFSDRNTAFDANTWANKRTLGGAPPRSWKNDPNYTLSVGGPIKKNQTFFFALWDGVIARQRDPVNTVVLTPCARNGIFRYYDNWNNGAADSLTFGGATPTIPVVDTLGNPNAPAVNPDGTPANRILRYASVFGQLPGSLPGANADCSNIAALVQPGTNWDPSRKSVDPTGYVKKVVNLMPLPNNYQNNVPNILQGGQTIDGLNTAFFQWSRSLHGSNNLFSIGEEQDRKQGNFKIDHNFNARHKVSVGFSYERARSDDSYRTWPDGWPGTHYSRPLVLTSNFTSTLSPSLVNEARFGMRRTGSNPISPIETPVYGDKIKAFIFNVANTPYWPHMGTGNLIGFQNSQPPGGRGTFQITQRDITPLYTYADTLAWTKGKHAFKLGGEVRFDRSKAIQNGTGFSATGSVHGSVVGGDAPLAQIAANAFAGLGSGLAGTTATGNNQRMRNLLSYLAGSVGSINQVYYINNPNDLANWKSYTDSPYIIRDFHQNELAAFFKDDYKVKRNLTLNLGLRWEYFGVPFEANGLTGSPVGGGLSAFGVSQDFNGWITPGLRGNPTAFQFVGPNSPNAGQRIYKRDWHDFGPAVGFAYQVPWLGQDKTTLRGGYQITYQGTKRGNDLQNAAGFPAGSIFSAQYGPAAPGYLDLTSLSNSSIVPVPTISNGSAIKPMAPILITDRTQSMQAYDPNLTTPYVQNFTLAITHAITPRLVAEVKYVGTLGLKQYQSLPINVPDFLNNGLKAAFDTARAGGESPLLDQMLKGVNLGQGTVGQNGFTGAQAMRLSTAIGGGVTSPLNTNLANGNYMNVAAVLSVLNYSSALNPGLPPIPAGTQGAVVRVNGFPENFILPNPQFAPNVGSTGLTTSTGVTYLTQTAYNRYHSMESSLTLRPTGGFSFTGTYTWSKNLGNPAGSPTATFYTVPWDRRGDYGRLVSDRTHDFRFNGTYGLPFGPGKALLRNSSGVLARVVEGWEMSWIADLTTGAPLSIGTFTTTGSVGVNSLYANGTPDIVGPFPFKDKGVRWGTAVPGVTKTAAGLLYGSYWDPAAFIGIKDPQCLAVAANLQSLCTLNAVADAKTGQVLLQNAQPGTRGNLGQNILEGPGLRRLDASVRKSFKVGETRSFQLRVDAYNVLNHPDPQLPQLNINVSPITPVAFGVITTKTLTGGGAGGVAYGTGAGGSQRAFQGQLRFNF